MIDRIKKELEELGPMFLLGLIFSFIGVFGLWMLLAISKVIKVGACPRRIKQDGSCGAYPRSRLH